MTTFTTHSMRLWFGVLVAKRSLGVGMRDR